MHLVVLRSEITMNVAEVFAKRLRELRGDISQSKLADDLNVSRGSISFYENGERVPDILFLNKAAKYFDIPVDYLLGNIDTREKDNLSIGEAIKLSDQAIDALKNKTKNVFSRIIIDALLIDEKFVPILVNYVFSFIHEHFQSSDFKAVPVRTIINPKADKILFAEMIERLPIFKDNLATNYEGDNDKIRWLILEYLCRNADIDACMDVIYRHEGPNEEFFLSPNTNAECIDICNYDDEDEPLRYEFEEPSEEFINILKQMEDEEKIKYDAISEFIKYYDSRGAINGNDN